MSQQMAKAQVHSDVAYDALCGNLQALPPQVRHHPRKMYRKTRLESRAGCLRGKPGEPSSPLSQADTL
jgi:hypothetical protein